jgi:hypothetical protein
MHPEYCVNHLADESKGSEDFGSKYSDLIDKDLHASHSIENARAIRKRSKEMAMLAGYIHLRSCVFILTKTLKIWRDGFQYITRSSRLTRLRLSTQGADGLLPRGYTNYYGYVYCSTQRSTLICRLPLLPACFECTQEVITVQHILSRIFTAQHMVLPSGAGCLFRQALTIMLIEFGQPLQCPVK